MKNNIFFLILLTIPTLLSIYIVDFVHKSDNEPRCFRKEIYATSWNSKIGDIEYYRILDEKCPKELK